MNRKIVSFFCILFQLSIHSLYAAAKPLPAAIVSVKNDRSDSDSEKIRSKLYSYLRNKDTFYIVDDEKVRSVLKYHEREIDSRQTEIKKLLSRSKEAYYHFNYIEAKSLASSVINKIQKRDMIAESGHILLDAYLTLGIINRTMGNVVEARQAFIHALRLDPHYKLDRRAFSPGIVKLFKKVKDEFIHLPAGSLKIKSKPKVAEVYINGILKGVTPLTVEGLPAGSHIVTVKANRYGSRSRMIDVQKGKKSRVKIRLNWSGDKKGKFKGESYITQIDRFGRLEEAVKIGDLLRVKKIITVDCSNDSRKKNVTVQMFDTRLRSGHKKINLRMNRDDDLRKVVSSIGRDLIKQGRENISDDPIRKSDPVGSGNEMMVGDKQKKKISKPLVFGIIGGVLAGALGAGLAAGLSSGSGNGGTGTLQIDFK